MLTAENISKAYGKQSILRNCSVSLAPGTITALIGPSGSGKTTLLKVLSLLEFPNRGRISLDSQSYDFPLEAKRDFVPPWPKITVVFQQLFLWPHLTLRENIMLPWRKQGKSKDISYLNSLIEMFDMSDFIDRFPNEVSIGQRQRTALARALVLEPEYILLDEITASLDVEQTAVILSELKDLRKKGIGILAITHLIHFARQAADQVLFMDEGQIVESGSAELLDNPQQERVKRFLSVIESAS